MWLLNPPPSRAGSPRRAMSTPVSESGGGNKSPGCLRRPRVKKGKVHIGVLGGFRHPRVHKTGTQLRALATLPNPVGQRVGLPAENTLRAALIT
eukprot:3663179-Pyramimonas_sp.AAC.1